MSPAPPLMTVEDYFRGPESLRPTELAFGIERVADAPTPRHQSAVLDLTLALDRHVREQDLGRIWISPLDVVLDPYDALIVQPDLMFISKAREVIVQDRVRGAPNLVIEVLSPNPRVGKTEEHIRWFAEYGVQECWLVRTERRTVTVVSFAARRVLHRLVHASSAPIRSRVLPDLKMSLDEILRSVS